MEILFQYFNDDELAILRKGYGTLPEPQQIQSHPSERRTVSDISPQIHELLNAKLRRDNMDPLDTYTGSSMVFYNIYDRLNTLAFHDDRIGKATHFYIICIEKGEGTLLFSTHIAGPSRTPSDIEPSNVNIELRLEPGDVVYWTDDEQRSVNLKHGGCFSNNRVTLVARFSEKGTI